MCSMTIWSRLSLDHQAQVCLFDNMKTAASLGITLVPKIESPFSISRILGVVAAGVATAEL